MYFGAAPACPWISSVSDFDSVSGSVLFSHSYAASCFFQFCRIAKLLYTDTHYPLRYSIHFKPFTALSESTECSFRFPTHSTSPPVSPPLFFSPGCHKFRTGTHRRTPRKEGDFKRPQNNKPKAEKPQEQKIGGLGALLLQAGIKASK